MSPIVDLATAAGFIVIVKSILQPPGRLLPEPARHAHLRAVPLILNPHWHAPCKIILPVIRLGECVVGKQVSEFVQHVSTINEHSVSVALIGLDGGRAMSRS